MVNYHGRQQAEIDTGRLDGRLGRIEDDDQIGLRISTAANGPANGQGHSVGARYGVRVGQNIGRRVRGRAVAETPEAVREHLPGGVCVKVTVNGHAPEVGVALKLAAGAAGLLLLLTPSIQVMSEETRVL